MNTANMTKIDILVFFSNITYTFYVYVLCSFTQHDCGLTRQKRVAECGLQQAIVVPGY
jgi:hypothetical protein